MPTQYIELNNVKGYRWGNKGKFYPTQQFGKKGAEEKANAQGRAILVSESRELKPREATIRASSRSRGYVKQI
jgi:hypothetical protein